MSSQEDILSKLREALKTSCDDAYYFSEDLTHLIDAEYLITVNAAKAIKELNDYFGTPYKIYLEHDTKFFATACTPLFGKKPANNFLGYRLIAGTKKNTKRKGKIDIAIYTSEGAYDVPVCAIEVKGFNPNRKNVVADLERNAEYFSLSSATGESKLPFTVFIALHSYKNTWNDKKEKSNIDKVRKRYLEYISGNSLLNSLSHSVDAFTIRRGIVPGHDNPDIYEMGLQGDEDYHFIGVIVAMNKEV